MKMFLIQILFSKKIYKFKPTLALILFIVSSCVVNGQHKYTKSQIDSIQYQIIGKLKKEGKHEQVVEKGIETAQLAEELNYTSAIIKSYLAISGSLDQMAKYDESIRYLDLANALIDSEDKKLKLRLIEAYGRNYSGLKLNQRSIDQYNKAISYYEKNKIDDPNFLAFLYKNKASVLDNDGQVDSSIYYLRKAFKIRQTTFDYISLAYHQLGSLKNLDSAEYYLNRAKQQMVLSPPSHYEQIILNINFGKLYKSRGEYDTAITYFEKAENLARQNNLLNNLLTTYKFLEETYGLKGESTKSYSYLTRYTVLNDSIDKSRKDGFNKMVDSFLMKQEKEHKSSQRNLLYITSSIVVISIILLTVLFIYYRNKRKARLKLVEAKEQESEVLRSKLNESFQEVIDLATANSPNFLTRFQEVYPEFTQRLLDINPNLVNTELTLCAMIYLNFSSKEIAQYTYIQPKTVQVKKYRLRKKLGIKKNSDIYNWMKNL